VAIRVAREQLGRVFTQRCFYLFILLLALIGGVPFVEPTPGGRLVINAIHLFIMVAAVAAVGRTVLSFVIILLLAAAALATQYLGIAWGDEQAILHSWFFTAGLYAAAITYMLIYVFQPEVMTADKLFGAASAYLADHASGPRRLHDRATHRRAVPGDTHRPTCGCLSTLRTTRTAIGRRSPVRSSSALITEWIADVAHFSRRVLARSIDLSRGCAFAGPGGTLNPPIFLTAKDKGWQTRMR
jgi:hypothetical protein